jgi:hypothetical protein
MVSPSSRPRRLREVPGSQRPIVQPGNLPIQPTSFVGRRRELAEAGRLLSTSRLLTLTDTGEVGKTRLAPQVAGFRNLLAHGHISVEPEWVWRLIVMRPPALKALVDEEMN